MMDISSIITVLQDNEPEEGYLVNFSGGKDSIVILDIVKRAFVKFEAIFSYTTVEIPGLLSFIRTNYPEVKVIFPPKTMYQLIEDKNMLPTRTVRFCCRELKEVIGGGRVNITGIRHAESFKRRQRNMFEISRDDKTKKFIHIIIDWSDAEVWEYIKTHKLPYPDAYDKGAKRIGCIGCPMSGKNRFKDYPNHYRAYLNTVQRMLNKKPSKYFGTDAKLMMDWWLSKSSLEKFIYKHNNEQEIKWG